MIAISLRFPGGRFHATPWGRHVNEGAVEWPPSPWRILRALVATWKRTLPDLPEGDVRPLLQALAEPPLFLLPPATTAHTRHFMPWFKKGPDDRTLVFDAFVAIPRDAEVQVIWPDAALDDAQVRALACIAANLNTLGRSESWCEAALSLSEGPPPSSGREALRCAPLDGAGVPADHEPVRVLCPDPATAFEDNHVVKVETVTRGPGKNRQTVERRSTIYDPAWNLCMETLQLHKERWSDPPGSRWIAYARPRACFKSTPRRRPAAARRPLAQVVRYALDSTVLPLATETLPVAEAARRRVMGIFKGQALQRHYGRALPDPLPEDAPVPKSPALSGKDEAGEPLVGHRHAYCLPADEDADGRLDHLTLFARDGFRAEECRALDALTGLAGGRATEARHPIRLLLLDIGDLADVPLGPLAVSRVWVSATPYLATRYAKTRGRERIDLRSPEARSEFLAGDLRAQIRDALPEADAEGARIEPLLDANGAFKVADRWRPIEFHRYRRKRADDGGRRIAGAFRIVFPEPVQGPVALGHSAHFGLGLFLPERKGSDP